MTTPSPSGSVNPAVYIVSPNVGREGRGIKELGQHDVLLSGGKHVMIMRSPYKTRSIHLLWWKSAISDSPSQLGVTIPSALNR
jgi:hypothetical protein